MFLIAGVVYNCNINTSHFRVAGVDMEQNRTKTYTQNKQNKKKTKNQRNHAERTDYNELTMTYEGIKRRGGNGYGRNNRKHRIQQ